ncbi:endonuclease/exonuclease/phosphatase family protein [Gallaecimonas sp. GXIMD4217]|uniref:endonuclease/exonuclease/phosphatase family protein n=1 Tax=Gallaecimonas sp. GXIMD4217 TaxID=3131927 RepID=UPI00311AD28B
MKSLPLLLAVALGSTAHAKPEQANQGGQERTLKVLSANLWHDLAVKPHYFRQGLAELRHLDADVILAQEADGATARLAKALGMHYWQGPQHLGSMGILSRYPIVKTFDLGAEAPGGQLGAVIDVHGRLVTLWNNHLDYTRYTAYFARGGNGTSWQALPGCQPYSDEQLEAANESSLRPRQARLMVKALAPLVDKRAPVIIGGDFNEPTGSDWTAATADLFDHKNVSYDFSSHRIVRQAGFTDSYRALYPDPVSHPGISWPFRLEDSWTQGPSYQRECGRGLDDRDRIDFIYYNRDAKALRLDSVAWVGPRFHTYFGYEQDLDWQRDPHVGRLVQDGEPRYGRHDFPSDHLWYLASFRIKAGKKQLSEGLVLNPELVLVESREDEQGLQLTVDVEHAELLSDAQSYYLYASTFEAGPGDYSGGWIPVPVTGEDKLRLSITVPAAFLANDDIQLRLYHRLGGSHRVDAVLDIERP